MSQFRVRRISALCRDLISFVETMVMKENWRPCLNELQTYFELDPTGIFVGELGELDVALLKYDDTFCFVSDLVMEKEYRGKGYGLELFNTAKKRTLTSHNMAAVAVDNMVDKYVEQFHFQVQWLVHAIDLHMSSALQVLSQSPSSSLYSAKTIDEVDPAALYDYDTKVFGYPRKAFLQKFLYLQGSHSRVAVDRDDKIVGYTAARVAVNKDEGYRLGPLYAESSAVAKILLKDLFEEMRDKGWSSSQSVLLDCPVGKNTEAKNLFELLDGKLAINLSYITTKGIPKGHFQSWFAMNNSFLG